MASLLNTKISNTYVGLIKTLDNAVISSSLKELSDGSGNATGIHINNAGDLKVTNILEFGSLKDTGENITISKFVDAADGIGSNNNDTTIPTSAAVATYVAAQITLEDLDFSGDSGTGSVDLDSQVFAVVGTANEIETSASNQQLQIGLPDNVTIGGNLQVNGLLKGNNNIIIKDTNASGNRTMAAFYGGDKVELYFNDSKKFETTSGGATITGGITATGGSVFTSATFSGNVVLDDNSGASPQIQFINGNNDTGEILLNSSGKLEISTGGTDRLIISSGDTEFTGDISLPDEVKLRVGSSNDLEIYHDSNNSYIQDTGTGGLRITSDVLRVLDTTNAEVMIKAEANAGVELYYDNSKKFETTNTGVTVTGVVVSDGLSMGDNEQIRLGDGEDLRLFHNGTDSSINNYNGDLYITNQADNKDIIFRTDDSTGGFTEYFRIDGGFGSPQTIFPDNSQLNFGNGLDLRIIHEGSLNKISSHNHDFRIIQNLADGDMSFYADDGSGGGTATYFRLDGGEVETQFLKSTLHYDNVKAQFGDSRDLEIYHDGSNSYITDSGTGNLRIGGTEVDILNPDSNEFKARFKTDGSVELYHNNSKKFETSSTGATITGNLVMGSGQVKFADNGILMLGDSNDLQIYHDGSNSFISDQGTGTLKILSNGLEIKNAGDSGFMAFFGSTGASELYFNTAKKFETSAGGVIVTGTIDASGTIVSTGGNIRVGSDTGKFMAGASNDLQIYHDGTKSVIEDTGTGDLHIIGDNDIVFKDGSGNILANMNAINSVELNFAGSNKFATTNTGVSVTGNIVGNGNLTLDNTGDGATSTITLGGNDLGNKSNSILFAENRTSGAMTYGFTLTNEGSTSNNFIIKSHNNSAPGISALTIARADGAISTGGNLTVAGDLTVNGTTTTVNTSTLAVEDPLISMAKDNSANSVDIGFYGRYNDGTNRYLGLFADASNSNKFKLFKGLTAEPTTTVDTTNAGYADADLQIGALTSGNITSSGELIVGSGEYISWGSSGSAAIEGSTVSNRLRFYTNSTLALTLDSSQDAVFAGSITATNISLSGNSSTIALTNVTDGNAFLTINHSGNENWLFSCESGSGTADFISINASGKSEKVKFGENGDIIADGLIQATGLIETSSVIQTSDGSVGAPSHTFSSDLNTGMFRSGADTIGFATGGSLALSIADNDATFAGDIIANGTNGIKINTTADLQTSAERLSVNGLSVIKNNSTTAATLYIQNHDTTADTIQPYIFLSDSGGNRGGLGVETSTADVTLSGQGGINLSTGASGVAGTKRVIIDNTGNTTFTGNVTLSSASSPTLAITDTTNTVTLKAYSQDANSHIGTVTNHPLIIDTNNTAAITISTGQLVTFSGNVNLADDKKLRLGDSEDFQIYHDGSHSFIDNTKGYTYLRNTGADSQGIIIRNDDAGDIHLDNDFAGNIIFSTSATNRMVLDSSGELKINKSIHLGNDSGVLTPSQYSMLIEAPSGTSTNLNMYTFGSSVFNIASDGTTATVGWGSTQEREVNLVNTGTGNIKVGINNGAPTSVLSVKTLQDSSFDEGIGVIRSNSSQTGYINMVGGAMNINAPADIPIKFRDNGTTNVEIKANGVLCQKGKAKTASIIEDAKQFTATNSNGSSGTNTDVEFTLSDYGVGNAGYYDIIVSASGYGSAGAAGFNFRYQIGGYSGHTANSTFHRNTVITDATTNCGVAIRNPDQDTLGIRVFNQTSGNQTIVGVIKIEITSTY